MNFVKKASNIIPRSLYLKFLSLIVFTIIGIFFELLGIGLVLPIITIVTTGNYDFDFGLGINKILQKFFIRIR